MKEKHTKQEVMREFANGMYYYVTDMLKFVCPWISAMSILEGFMLVMLKMIAKGLATQPMRIGEPDPATEHKIMLYMLGSFARVWLILFAVALVYILIIALVHVVTSLETGHAIYDKNDENLLFSAPVFYIGEGHPYERWLYITKDELKFIQWEAPTCSRIAWFIFKKEASKRHVLEKEQTLSRDMLVSVTTKKRYLSPNHVKLTIKGGWDIELSTADKEKLLSCFSAAGQNAPAPTNCPDIQQAT
jgi:hypothetical protein